MNEFTEIVSFQFLAAAVIAAWLPDWHFGRRAVPSWATVFVVAMAVALWAGVLAPIGAVALLALWALASGARVASRAGAAFAVAAMLLALALALHAVPGFHPSLLQEGVKLTDDAVPFKLSASFDKPAAGLILLGTFCRPRRDVPPFDGTAVAWTLVVAVVTATASIGLAVAVGHTRFEPKWPPIAGLFLASNLLFTCVAEEAFFRGVIQDAIARLGDARASGRARLALHVLAVVVSTASFGLAHVGGGATFMAVAAIAGLGYGVAYAKTRRIEAAILVHFIVNATHFVGFTYPALAR